MSTLYTLIEAWDEGHREFDIAFENLSDEDLWRRAHPRLLSVGELAGHVAYWQGVWVMGDGNDRPDLAQLPIESPLIDHRFRYYTSNVEAPAALGLGVAEVLAEVARVHEAAKQSLRGKEITDPYPGQWDTYGKLVSYQVFHVAYHTGQIYSVRHLLGHATEDN